jgi:hypothetical protein
MLTAMLEATGRLSAFARQSSELGAWLRAREGSTEPPLRVDALHALLVKTDTRHQWEMQNTPDLGGSLIPAGADGAMLATALVAVADAVAREHNSPSAVMHFTREGDALTISARPTSPRKSSQTRGSAAPDREAFFAQGGLGLGLVTASHVFARLHGTITRQPDDSLQLAFPVNPIGGPP